MAKASKRPGELHHWLLISLGILLAIIFLVLPLTLIFAQALSGGVGLLWQNLNESYMTHAIKLTLLAAVMTVPINLVFGILLAWCVTHYDFVGRRLLIT